MSGTTNSITPSQVLDALQLQGANAVVADEILSGSQLVGINLAALGMLLKNEVGGKVAQSYSVSPPGSNGAQADSGWTIGVTQLDFNTNSGAAQALLENALEKSNVYDTLVAQQIAQAFTNAGTSSTVSLPTGVTLPDVEAALATPAAVAAINQNADQSTAVVIDNVNSVVGQITNSAVRQALTPGSPAFNPTAYLALVDYAN